VLKNLGSISGALALLWTIWLEYRKQTDSFLQVSLKMDQRGSDYATALTAVGNKRGYRENINYAGLLVAPADMSVNEVLRAIISDAGGSIPSRRLHYADIPRVQLPKYSVDQTRVHIPLPFFFEENAYVGDEDLSFRTPIDLGRLKANMQRPVAYAVRFFVIGAENSRMTEDLLFNPGLPSSTA
jgi:hypothetical protein